MTSTTLHSNTFEKNLHHECLNVLREFKKIGKFCILFHVIFFALAASELLGFLLFFSFFTKSSILAFSLASLFLTGFSYFVLHFYFQAKRPEQLSGLRSSFIATCAESIHFPKESSEFHTALSYAILQLATLLEKQEYNFYSMPKWCQVIHPILKKFSSRNHWKDLHDMREKLLFAAIEQYVEQVKLEPTDLETHASLAEAYLQLARLYQDPRKLYPEENLPWVSPEYETEFMRTKFLKVCERALEEYKILDTYSPDSPWTHAKLASIYRDLHLPEEEICTYEKMLEIAPHDTQILFRLGVLYFEQGLNAKGLKIYELLQHTEEAAELIRHYNAGFLDSES